jgi:hypothetical protein
MTENINIIKFTDGNLIELRTDLDDIWLDWYMENGVIDWIYLRFDNNTDIDINADNGVDRTELMTFFAQDFGNMTVNDFIQNLIRFVGDLGGFKNAVEV